MSDTATITEIVFVGVYGVGTAICLALSGYFAWKFRLLITSGQNGALRALASLAVVTKAGLTILNGALLWLVIAALFLPPTPAVMGPLAPRLLLAFTPPVLAITLALLVVRVERYIAADTARTRQGGS